MKIVTIEEMRAIEDRSEEAGVSKDTLMENAGQAVARSVRHHYGPLTGVPVFVLVGSGNNGGDGLVAARHLDMWGARVEVCLCRDRRAPDPKLDVVRKQGIRVTSASDDPDLSNLTNLLSSAHVVIDSILGTGRARPIEGTVKAILQALKEAQSRTQLKVVALDVPTGLNADTGEVDPSTPRADLTISFGYPKRGHYAYPGSEYLGRLEVANIGLPAGLDDDVTLELITDEWARDRLPNRPANSHKGTFGRTMVIAGSRNYLGAAYLAATSATRVGSGLVTVAIPESLRAAVAAKAIEPTFLPLPESSPGIVSPDAADLVFDSLPAYNSLLVGCGMGQESDTKQFIERLLLSGHDLPPTVVDADGLNTLSQVDNWWTRLPDDAILTPHPGEMGRLTENSSRNQDRIATATMAATQWNKTVILKGAHTVIGYPDGNVMVSPFSNPGLATAGTGDVLAGAIAGLVSQGLSLSDASALGVYLHGLAGERVRDALGDTGMIASDLLSVLPAIIRDLRQDVTI
ncbi:MAG: NAD(P)H-hydrate dehydratase [SAR202 cluster bacterium]|jgi:NAD(P)H-hydrate epimerase|nr:NAD(P)H-hydrate dehydratase [SAR202 cluster bacterium]MDP6512548.1 NAD(P)H-hydrate dehydratase [SAR202 cluster bacterium]MDP6714101.1 NAD(P)H-hydrate dehydratase [SAR202 cluster bacterium]